MEKDGHSHEKERTPEKADKQGQVLSGQPRDLGWLQGHGMGRTGREGAERLCSPHEGVWPDAIKLGRSNIGLVFHFHLPCPSCLSISPIASSYLFLLVSCGRLSSAHGSVATETRCSLGNAGASAGLPGLGVGAAVRVCVCVCVCLSFPMD